MIDFTLYALNAVTVMIIGFFILWPFLTLKPSPTSQNLWLKELEIFYQEKERCLKNLRDLEWDYQAKKINDQDYETLCQELLTETNGVYKKINEIEQNPILQAIEKTLDQRL